MPDLQSELAKVNEALASWSEPSTETTMTSSVPTAFKESNGVSRATFNYVRDNPGQHRMEIIRSLEKQGFKESSTSSLLAQMSKQGQIRSVAGCWFANQKEYTPLKSLKVFNRSLLPKPAKQKRAKPVATHEPVVVIEVPPATPIKEVTQVKAWSPDDVIDSLNVKQAMALYDALHKIFRL